MAKMFEIKGKTATQNAFLAFTAYNRAKALVSEHNGKIDSEDGKTIKATFKSNADAKAFADAFERAYTKAHKAYVKAHGKSVKAKAEVKTEPKKVASARKAEPRKPARAKGNSVDFAKFQGTKSEKNRALHAHLVSMGMKDSRTAEYQAIWNARPWAK